MKSSRKSTAALRVRRHRARQQSGGRARVEVTVPEGDAGLVRAVADCLRAGGAGAAALRDALAPFVKSSRASTGTELVAFFRRSPLVGEELQFERDPGPGRESPL